MKAMVGVVAIALAVGCGVESPGAVETQQAIGVKCPNPDDPCTLSNGVGVYTEEGGNASIGPDDFMILRFFQNTAGTFSVRGRWKDPSDQLYKAVNASVFLAYYQGVPYNVSSMGEYLTSPKFMLTDDSGNPPLPVTGDQITDLELVLYLPDGMFTVGFAKPNTENIPNAAGTVTLHSYRMRWHAGNYSTTPSWNAYCHAAPTGSGTPIDPVVFQQDIAVNPVTAVMARNTNVLTVSCRLGAIAVARQWGYVYRGDASQSTMFEAAMHMKRASYCGDEIYYTQSGTPIDIQDNVPIQNSMFDKYAMEASWGRGADGTIHALCLTEANERHPNLVPYPFDRTCGGRWPASAMPNCPMTGAGGPYGMLADRLDPSASP